MHPDLPLHWRIPLATVLLLQCTKSPDPTVSTSGEMLTGGGPSPSEPSEPTGGVETEGAGAHAPCDRYLACVAAIQPDALAGAEAGFGDGGTCWQGGATEMAQCIAACREGLVGFHQVYPDEPACLPCGSDADCDAAAGEVCSGDGLCTSSASCGDGLVQPGEICDGDGCDADCMGPPVCTPYHNTGCSATQACIDGLGQAYCKDLPANVAGRGEPCGADGVYDTFNDTYYGETYYDEFIECAGGLKCVDCGSENCCADYCVIGGEPCPDGQDCMPLSEGPPFAYLGVCRT